MRSGEDGKRGRFSGGATRRAGACVLLVALLTAGCRVGPEYRRPDVRVPDDWRWKIAEPSDHLPRGEWWQVFEDERLAQLEREATVANHELEAAFYRVEQARAAARIDRAEFYPWLSGRGTFTRYRTSGNSPSPVPFPVPSFTQEEWSIPFDLSYEVDLWGRVRRSFEAARQTALSAEAARQSVLLTLQSDVAATYFAIQSLETEMDLLEQAIQLRRQALQIFDQRFEAGIGDEFQVQRARVEVAASEADWEAAKRRRAAEVNALAVLCGAVPSEFVLMITEEEWTVPEISPGLPSSLLERRPDVAEAERQLAALTAEIGVAKSAFFPAVRLTAAGGVLSGEATDLLRWDSRIWSIGPSISWPVFQGGRNRANLERARAAYEEGVAIYRQRVLVAFREVEDSLAALNFLEQEVQARVAAAKAATEAARLSLERYRAGSVNFLEVVDSENARLSHELARVRAQNERRLAVVRLIKALGGGWETEEL